MGNYVYKSFYVGQLVPFNISFIVMSFWLGHKRNLVLCIDIYKLMAMIELFSLLFMFQGVSGWSV